MKLNFSLILPVKDNLHLVNRLLKSIVDTTDDCNRIEVILYVDDDDTVMKDYSYNGININKIIGTKDSMGNIIKKCYAKTKGRYLFLLNDDVVFHTKGWDNLVLEAFSKFDDDIALVYGNDLYYGKDMCTFPIVSRKIYNLLDELYPEEYEHHCIDSHVFDIFKKLEKLGYKRMIYLKNVFFEHMHYDLGISACLD
ncbi:hypothetical protein ACFL4O_03410, partial [bacterium]